MRVLVFLLPLSCTAGLAAQSVHSNAGAREEPRQIAETYLRLWQEAANHFDGREYDHAATLYESLVRHNPHDGSIWLRLGRCRDELDQYLPALEAYDKAMKLGFGSKAGNHLRVARVYARMGQAPTALDWIERALEARLEDRVTLAQDEAFAGLRENPRFAKAAGKLPDRPFDRDEGWRYDLLFLAAEIDRLHPDPYHTVDREAIAAAVQSLHERIPDLTDEAIVFEMQRIAVLLGDGHSVVYPIGGRIRPMQVPLRFYWFSDGLYVIDSSSGSEKWIGSRVVAFGKMPTEDALRALDRIVSCDNPMGIRWLGPLYLRIPATLRALNIIDDDPPSLVLEDRNGHRHVIVPETEPVTRAEMKLVASRLPDAGPAPKYLDRVGDNYWCEVLSEHRALFVQFNQVRDMPNESIRQFAQRVRKLGAAPDIDHLVLDLRHNNGGNSSLTLPLLQVLIHFELTQAPGKLFVLIGRNTFSAAMDFATDLDRLTSAIFVGEPTGSRPNFVGENTDVVLPYSKVRASISSRYWQQSSPGDDRLWIAPRVFVPLSSSDYFANRDPVLAAVLNVIRSEP